jgi:hypothetical protein
MSNIIFFQSFNNSFKCEDQILDQFKFPQFIFGVSIQKMTDGLFDKIRKFQHEGL